VVKIESPAPEGGASPTNIGNNPYDANTAGGLYGGQGGFFRRPVASIRPFS
jgi:hypothetical protein